MRILLAFFLVLTILVACTSETQSPAAADEVPAVVAFDELPAEKAGTVQENPKDGLKYVWIPPGKFMMGCSERGQVMPSRRRAISSSCDQHGLLDGTD